MLVPTASGLPHALLSTYDSYKRGTKICMNWLRQNSFSRAVPVEESGYTLSDYVKMAENIRQRNIHLPSDVAFTFRDTIALRQQTSNFFNGLSHALTGPDKSTVRHETFTTTLQDIYGILSSVKAPSPTQRKPSSPQHVLHAGKTVLDGSPGNRFAALPIPSVTPVDSVREKLEHNAVLSVSSATDTKSKSESRVDSCVNEHSAMDDGVITDDLLALVMETLLSLQSLDVLMKVVKSSWQRAARNDISLAVAALSTKAAWDWSAEHRRILLNSGFWTTLEGFQTFDFQMMLIRGPTIALNYRHFASAQPCTYGDGILLPLEVMIGYLKFGPKRKGLSCLEAMKHLGQTPNRQDDEIVLRTLLDDQVSYLKSPVHYDFNLSPEISRVQEWLECEARGCKCARVQIAFQLRLQLEAMRAYTWIQLRRNKNKKSGTKAPSSIVVLKGFVEEAITTLTAVAEHRGTQNCCTGSLGVTCLALVDDLQYSVSLSSPPTSYHCPFSAGRSLLSIHASLYPLGMRIINHRHYVASILHVYNALRVMSDIEPIEFLDELCSIFEDIIFLGKRPKRNFHSCFIRHRGGKVQFAANGLALGSNAAWGMKTDDYTIVDGHIREANHYRFQHGPDYTLFTNTYDFDYLPTEDYYWSHVIGAEKRIKATESDRAAIMHWFAQCKRPEEPLEQIEAAHHAEFTGLPIPRLDIACCQALQAQLKTTKSKKSSVDKTSIHCAGCSGGVDCPCLKIHDCASHQQLRLVPDTLNSEQPKELFTLRNNAVMVKERGTGRLPVLQINYGAVYLACAEAFMAVDAGQSHAEAKAREYDETGKATTCLCAVDMLLMYADFYVNRAKKSAKFGKKKLKKSWISAMEGLRAKDVDDFVWKSLKRGCID